MVEDPHGFLARLRQEEPISFSPVLNAWLVSRYDDVCEVWRDPIRFSSSPMLQTGTQLTAEARAILADEGFPMGDNPLCGPSVLASDPPAHTRLRRLLNRGFTPARVAAVEPHIRQFARELLDGFAADGRAELVSQLATQLPLRVILHLVGAPREDMPRIKRWCEDWFTLLFTHVPPEAQPPLARSVAEYQRYCLELVEARWQAPQDDLVSDLVAAEPGGEVLTMPELIMAIQGSLLASGHETTTSMLSNTLGLLLREPGLWERLQREPALLPRAIEECIRYEGIMVSTFRMTTREVTLGGVTLPQGALVALLHMSANRDAAHFPEPDRFDIHREKQHSLTFGRYAHFCPGAQLARREIQIAIEQLLERMPTLRLAPHHRFEFAQDMAFRKLKSLHVEWRTP